MSYKKEIDQTRIPAHVAIIMDGNGRWAKQRGLNRSAGHQAGADILHRLTKVIGELGVKYLTLYTFSMENWSRPVEEVGALMKLLLEQLEDELFMKHNIRFRIIGDLSRMPNDVVKQINHCIEVTSQNTGLCMTLALSYSSKWEITEAIKQISTEVRDGRLAIEDINEDTLDRYLATNYMPDPDLLIRTGGEIRLSNYLLWQCAYSELYFCDTFWPDFDEEEFYKAIFDYQQRERRFGKTSEQI